MNNRTFLDIESAALPESQLLIPEFEPPGNLKDPEKIKAALADKRSAWLEGCALKATTGRIIAASLAHGDDEPEFICSPDELTMVQILIQAIDDCLNVNGRLLAWNGCCFDYPCIAQRAAAHNLPVFHKWFTNFRGRYSWNESFIDPMQIFAGPYNRPDGCSLSAVAHALGVGEKSGNGKDFAKLLRDDPVAAKAYALNDVVLLRKIVSRMGQ